MLIPNDDALVTRVELERQFKEKMKEQERQAIKALIAGKEAYDNRYRKTVGYSNFAKIVFAL